MPDPSNHQPDGRDRILDEAEALFQKRGYTAVSMRDISLAVGVRQASLYYHFPSKEELFVAMRERMFQRHHVGLNNACNRADKDLRSQLQAAADWFLSQPPMRFFGMMQSDMPSLSETAKQHLAEVSYRSIFMPIEQLFIVAQANGTIRSVQAEILAGFFLSVLESIPLFENEPGVSPKEEIVRDLISVLLEGIQVR